MTTGPKQAASIWALKPWWCQPWSIVLTGITAVGLSCLWLGRWWISLPLALVVLAWWGLFLVLVPSAWRQEQQAQLEQQEGLGTRDTSELDSAEPRRS